MSVSSIQYAGNGNFTMTVNGKAQTFNLADLNTMLRMEQVASYDEQIADQLGEIQRTNQKRKTLNALMARMRKEKGDGKNDDVAKDAYSLPGESGTKTTEDWMKHLGLGHTDVPDSKSKTHSKSDWSAAWDANINNVKTAIDNITSDSEMQMLRFRQMVDKRGTALQEAKTTLTNDKRLKDAIVQG